MQSTFNEDLALVVVLALLLVGSAFDVTSRAAVWVGLFLLFIIWVSAYQNGTLKTFGQELTSKPGSQT